MDDIIKKWGGFYLPLEQLLIRAGENSGDKNAARVARACLNYLFSNGKDYLDGSTLHILSTYDNELQPFVVAGKLEIATDEERMVLFSKGKVSSRAARQRLPIATPVERGLIAAYYPRLFKE